MLNLAAFYNCLRAHTIRPEGNMHKQNGEIAIIPVTRSSQLCTGHIWPIYKFSELSQE